MRFVPYHDLDDTPNVVVDGYGTSSTILTLSHWPGSATPHDLRDDLSTQIVFRYLDRPDLRTDAEAASNNHFDEDGLCGLYALIHPAKAAEKRDRLIDIASAGDFGVFADRDSARIAFALMAFSDDDTSPLDLQGSYPEQTATLYDDLLGRLPEMLDHPERFETLWQPEDERLAATDRSLADGRITIEERPDIDLAIVTVRDDASWPHEAAINNRTRRMRVLTIHQRRYQLRYRYETWVVYVSEPLPPRKDLRALAEALQQKDTASWRAGNVDDLTPSLEPRGHSRLEPETVRHLVERYLQK